MKVLFWKELSSYFKNPLGYVFMVIFLFGLGYLTFELGRGSFFYLREASLASMFKYIPWMFLFLIPAVSMRLWSEERRSGTVEMLLTLPITVNRAVLAKFFAAWVFIGINLLGTLPMVFTVEYLGSPDYGVIFLGYLGAFLMAGALLAIGSFFSALSKNQVISFILTTVVSFTFIMAGSPPVLEFISTISPKYIVDLFEGLSIMNHFDYMQRGVISLGNIWFFFVMIGAWLYASTQYLNENKAN